jgi:hypothetical protein
VVLFCRQHPTPEQLDHEEREKRRKLRLANIRAVAARALEAKRCLDGELPRMDDSTRRDVSVLVGPEDEELGYLVKLLAWWSAFDATGARAEESDWVKVRTAAEMTSVVDLLVKTHSAIQSAVAESHVPKRNRRLRT